MVRFFNQDVSFNISYRLLLKKWIKFIISSYKSKVGDISIIFCSDSYLLRINKEFLGHDYYTDIITFDYCEGKKISGDLFISIDCVKENSLIYGCTFEEELHRVIIHGVLHLLKEDDHTQEQKQMMREAEDFALKKLADLQSLNHEE